MCYCDWQTVRFFREVLFNFSAIFLWNTHIFVYILTFVTIYKPCIHTSKMYWDHILHYLLYSPSFPFELLSKYSTSDCTIEDAIPPSPPPRHPPPPPVMGCRRADVHCCCVLKIEMTGTYLDDSVSWNSSPSLAFNILSCQSQSAPTPMGVCVSACLSVI